MKRWGLYVSVSIVFLFGLPNDALATNVTATHIVTVRAEPFAVISLLGNSRGNSTCLVVDGTGIATESHELKWSTNLEGMRVIVQSNLAADEQDYILRVRAVDLNSKGRAKGWVVINEEASTLITGIVREIGRCSIEYEASPKIRGKAVRDEHIITYTITE
jgi:hypothetical protein